MWACPLEFRRKAPPGGGASGVGSSACSALAATGRSKAAWGFRPVTSAPKTGQRALRPRLASRDASRPIAATPHAGI